MSPTAKEGLDRYDRIEPPPVPAGGLALYFLRAGDGAGESRGTRCYEADIQPQADTLIEECVIRDGTRSSSRQFVADEPR